MSGSYMNTFYLHYAYAIIQQFEHTCLMRAHTHTHTHTHRWLLMGRAKGELQRLKTHRDTDDGKDVLVEIASNQT